MFGSHRRLERGRSYWGYFGGILGGHRRGWVWGPNEEGGGGGWTLLQGFIAQYSVNISVLN